MDGTTPDTESRTDRLERMTREFNERAKHLKGRKRPAAHDIIAQAAQLLGGHGRLAAWAVADDKNEDKFWTALFPKLIAAQGSGADDEPVRIAAAIEAARKRVRDAEAAADDSGGGAP